MSSRGVMRVMAALVLVLLAACGGPAQRDQGITLRWYVGPDRVDADSLAETCTAASEGEYTVKVVRLPADVDDRHSLVVRRLAAEDDGIDILSVDSSFTAELAAGQYLAPVPEDLKASFAQDVFPAALGAASVDGSLVVAPWWYDPYLLWYRGNTAERAGLDTTKPIVWDDLLAGAERGVGDDRAGREQEAVGVGVPLYARHTKQSYDARPWPSGSSIWTVPPSRSAPASRSSQTMGLVVSRPARSAVLPRYQSRYGSYHHGATTRE
ncbi:MAG: extracellular solute-binding protein, partial [Actinomycetales bacterium]